MLLGHLQMPDTASTEIGAGRIAQVSAMGAWKPTIHAKTTVSQGLNWWRAGVSSQDWGLEIGTPLRVV